MYVLGINELYHDCSAALVEDGHLVGVVEEERLDRVKHTPGLCWGGGPPDLSVDWCLREFGVRDSDVAAVALSYEMNSYLALKTIVDAVLANMRRLKVADIISQRVRGGDPAASVVYGNIVGYFGRRQLYLKLLERRFGRVFHIPHHLAHAASAYRMSGYDEANVLVVDGLGEDHSTSLYHGTGREIRGPFENWSQYQSLGMLYKTITFLLGFGYFGDGKTMGLSSYGTERPGFGDIIEVSEHGYRIHLERIRSFSPYARKSWDAPITEDHQDLARSIQAQLERAGVALARNLYDRTGSRNLCLAGGVALNCNMNTVLRSQPFIDDLFVQPGAMDMGSAIGAALEVSKRLGVTANERLQHVSYGPQQGDDEIGRVLAEHGLTGERLDEEAMGLRVAQTIEAGKIVGWFNGRLEFGPRALGNRSIVARPDDADLRDRVNDVKQRERWRPLAPSMLEDKVEEWFVDGGPSPFMTLTFTFRPEQAPRVPGVVHVDGTARVQTVTRAQNAPWYDMIRQFEQLTGLPMVVNTSFNRRSEPIVCTAAEAIATWQAADMDALRLGPYFLEKTP